MKWREKVKTQNLWGLTLFPSFYCLLSIYLVLAFVLILIGSIMLGMALNIKDYRLRYDNIWQGEGATCSINFRVHDTIKDPYIYYELENFYGNHRNFVKSLSYSQLRADTTSSESSCDPIKEVEDIGSVVNNLDGNQLNKEADANPWGLIAKYYFNDAYVIKGPNPSTQQIAIDSSKISHSVDRNSRFKRPDNYRQIQYRDTENEHLMVWYQTDAFPNFIKLYGKLDSDLKEGEQYVIEVTNNWVKFTDFEVKKYVYFSEANAFGGNNVTFGVLYICGGGTLLILSFVMVILEIRKRSQNHKMGRTGSTNGVGNPL
jgi:hypothetical protein